MASIVGLDLSLTSTGLAFVKDGQLVAVNAVRSAGKKGDDLNTRRLRLRERIADKVIEKTDDFEPTLVVIEAPSFGSTVGHQHDRSGLWWLVVDALRELDYPVAEVSPASRAKYGTGKGNSKKEDVYAAVKMRYERPDLEIAGNDLADAVILACMGSRKLGREVEVSLPLTHLDAMTKVAWPLGLVAS